MNKKIIIPQKSKDKYDKWHFAPAVESQGFVFVSGCTGNKPDGTISDNAEEQFRQSFLTIEESLTEAGLTFDHVVEITSYHIGLKKNLRTFMKVKDEFIKAPYPAWTAIGISELAVEGAIIEISVIATKE